MAGRLLPDGHEDTEHRLRLVDIVGAAVQEQVGRGRLASEAAVPQPHGSLDVGREGVAGGAQVGEAAGAAGASDGKLALLDLESCRIDVLGPDWQTSAIYYMDDITADGRFILYSRTQMNEGGAVVAAPFRGSRPMVEAEQLPLVSEPSSANYPKWSADGRTVFFQSNRDGHWCLWARRVDERSKDPFGEPFAVRHLHSHRLSLSPPGSPFFRREMDVSRDRLFFPLTETTGNIWLLVPTRE